MSDIIVWQHLLTSFKPLTYAGFAILSSIRLQLFNDCSDYCGVALRRRHVITDCHWVVHTTDVIRRIVWRLIPCHYRTIVRLIGPAGQVISMTSSSHNGLWKADLTGPKIDLEHYVSLTCNVLRFCIWCTHWGLCQSQCHRPQGNTLLHLQLLRSSVPTPHFSRKCSGAHNHMFGGS